MKNPQLGIQIKQFKDLSLSELYAILQLRAEVFVIEQDCIYQDIDGKDEQALHILGFYNDKLVAYTRCYAPHIYFEEAAIGRVVVEKSQRKYGFGHLILEASIKAIEDEYQTKKIKLSAQQYLTRFYESHQFNPLGKGYLEDGIPHIAMLKKD
ncbi:GNAT family N-acetyltransferase [Mesonia ostreae]|uniref:GNAT family N-acetyltransferase n=1 Tax=Mesonia ostreae TaxID=861110 RepID=A0ABU2KIZ4_9FLAO|nr:GNAT family N-acetyltransferase [Mesonia ostreae]MDT0294695.1 GNAT family N-acetyltransferase [Mesonia ostreae]